MNYSKTGKTVLLMRLCLCAAVTAVLFLPHQALAICEAVTLGACVEADVGKMQYSAADDTFRFCDKNTSNWVSMRSTTPGGLSLCTTPGTMRYNSANGIYEFCDNGNVWTAIAANVTSRSCSDAGVIEYNSSSKSYEYCNGSNWADMKRPDGSPSPGDVCDDGSVYAGTSPDGSVDMYVTPCDQGESGAGCGTGSSTGLAWNDGTSTFNLIGVSDQDDGDGNTATIMAAVASLPQSHEAAEECDGLTAHGHSDWYLPAENELGVINTNYVAIGGFVASDIYWSSTENVADKAVIYRISDASSALGKKSAARFVRCARHD